MDSATLREQDLHLDLSMPKIGKISHIDRGITSALSSADDYNKTIILDFSQSDYIEVVSLVYMLSLLRQRREDQLNTFIKLPNRKDIRDFLRAWQFPKAVLDTTGLKFKNIVVSENHQYFGENPNLTHQKYHGVLIGQDQHTQLLMNYLPILTFHRFSTDFIPSLALNEANRWKRQVVTSVLEKHLQGPHGYFTSRIVFEAMMNAIRHPQAKIILTASNFQSPGRQKEYSKGFLTVVWWDDGLSIIDTLKAPLNKGDSIHHRTPEIFNTVYQLHREGFDPNLGLETVKSNLILDSTTKDEYFLLSAIFPGVTSDPTGKTLVTHPDLAKESNTSFTLPGMGLYLLVNTAVKIYKGSVAFRTRDFFMHIEDSPSDGEFDYLVRIRRYPGQFTFQGNMLTVRLPLRKDKEGSG